MYRMFCKSYLNYMKVNQYEAPQYDKYPGNNSSKQNTPSQDKPNSDKPNSDKPNSDKPNQDNLDKEQRYTEPYRGFRSEITRPIGVLADVSLYAELRNDGGELFRQVGNLVFAIQQRQDMFPSLRAFSWELYGYGFDAQQHDGFPEDVLEEQLKLIDLLLSCHYWLVA